MRKNKATFAISLMTTILMAISVVPAQIQIHAEEMIAEETVQSDYSDEDYSSENTSNGIIVNPCKHGTVDIEPEITTWGEIRSIVTAIADDGYYPSSLTAVDEYGNDAVYSAGENYIIVNDQFHNVTVNAVFTCIDPSIYVNTHNGKVLVKVNGVEADEVEAGDTVTMEFIPDRGYEFKKDMYFVCEEQPEVEWNGNICTFVMPGCGNLGVYAEFPYVLRHHVSLMHENRDIKIKCMVEGAESFDAYAGDEVSIEVSSEDYYIDGLRIENGITGETIFETDDNKATFTMPASDAKVYASSRDYIQNITVDNTKAPHLDVRLLDDNDVEKSDFRPGTRVHTPVESPDSKYYISELKARTVSGTELDVHNSDDEIYFTMPEEDVIVSLSEGIQYFDESGTRHRLVDYQLLSAAVDQPGVTLTSGWYVAEGAGWGFNNRVTINGDVNIILTDNCGVIFNRGIQNNQYGHLIIWGQKEGNGCIDCVNAFGDRFCAGIGGNTSASGGHFEMHGGIVNAQGQYGGAGIGGSQYGSGGVISIYGGTVNATGADYGAGIGGGMGADGGTISIYGGTVNAQGNCGGAGIGGGAGDSGNGGLINISGGTVTAAGGNKFNGAGAGIGGGNHASGGTINISGGNVEAKGAPWAAGIGGGNCGDGGTITIEGGSVLAFGNKGGAGIGGGDDGDGGTITLNSAGVEAHGYLAIGHGDGGDNQSITMAYGIGIEGLSYSVRISALNYAKDVKLTYVDNVDQPVTYNDENGESYTCSTYTLLSEVKDQPGATLTSGWYVVKDAGWGFNNRVTISGDVNIILTDNCHVIFNRGIQNNTYGKLSIWGQSAGNGRMDCVQAFETSGGNAGIGGDKGASGGTFILHGGNVSAYGQNNGAGIGGGENGDGGIISIYGGTVEAFAGEDGAGIGGGYRGSSNTINILNGNVHAHGNDNGASIGGGEYGDGGQINISGGTVFAHGERGEDESFFTAGGAGIGGGEDRSGGTITISGGNINAFGSSGTAGGGAGIGGGDDATGGNITITGGYIHACGGHHAAGIGGGSHGTGGEIIIENGRIDAKGGDQGAAIGGGNEGDGGHIRLCGGEINAEGYMNGAGIGGGDNGNSGYIEILGGTVNATGGDTWHGAGAGIGGGDCGSGDTIQITGGVVTASGAAWAAGIGGGNNGDGGDISINGGTVKAYGSKGGAGIGGGDDGSVNNIYIFGGTVEGHGYRAVGCGEDGDDGTITLGDNVDIVGFDWNDRYRVLSYGHDLLLIAR